MNIHDAFRQYFDNINEQPKHVRDFQLLGISIVNKDPYQNMSNQEILDMSWDNSHWTMDK